MVQQQIPTQLSDLTLKNAGLAAMLRPSDLIIQDELYR